MINNLNGEVMLKERDEFNIIIKNVNLIPMTGEYVVENSSVVIKDGKISFIGSVDDSCFSGNSLVIDGTNKFLCPGFSDMHAHNYSKEQGLLFIANGVTSIRNMGAVEGTLELRNKINAKELLGPEIIFTVGAILDGKDPLIPGSIELNSPDEVKKVILEMKSEGYDGIKVYEKLKSDVYKEILKVASDVSLPVVGHIPNSVTIKEATEWGQFSIEHLCGFTENYKEEIEYIVKSGTWICNTEIVKFYIDKCFTRESNPEIFSENHYTPELKYAAPYFRDVLWPTFTGNPIDIKGCGQLLKELYEKGANIVSGTDAGAIYTVSGFCLHKEFELLHQAGLSPYQILLTTTVNPAKMHGLSDRLGSVEVGKDADLVLLDKNPLTDIRNSKSITGVITKGRWLPRKELDNLLEIVIDNYSKM